MQVEYFFFLTLSVKTKLKCFSVRAQFPLGCFGTNNRKPQQERLQRQRQLLLLSSFIWKFHVVIWQTTSKNCAIVRAARAARLFFFIQPIRSFFFWRCHCRCPCLSSQLSRSLNRVCRKIDCVAGGFVSF